VIPSPTPLTAEQLEKIAQVKMLDLKNFEPPKEKPSQMEEDVPF
jgi:hypothetical protein